MIAKFKEKLNTKVRRQENIDKVENRDFRRRELLGKYMAKILYE